ncbi:MAG: DUF6763 family protein [Steroidobacteraceae bacterium]
MPNELDPLVEQWYEHRDKGGLFQVVAIDGDAGLVEIQHFDGDIEELDMETWRNLAIELADEPEDWTGPFDDTEPDDLGDTEAPPPLRQPGEIP